MLPEEIVKKLSRQSSLKDESISYSVINPISKGIVVASDTAMLVEHGGHLTLTVYWAQNVLKEITPSERKMVRRIATTSKIQNVPRLLKEEQFIF